MKHGHSTRIKGDSPTYSSWTNMWTRCTNTKRDKYKNYGGRGITVCEHWKNFENFLADMGERPEGLTLDRKDNELGYFKENCRWATSEEQSLNKQKH
jgi:hypothetical protein